MYQRKFRLSSQDKPNAVASLWRIARSVFSRSCSFAKAMIQAFRVYSACRLGETESNRFSLQKERIENNEE